MMRSHPLQWSTPLPATLLLIIGFFAISSAQSTSPGAHPDPKPSPTPSLEKQFLRNILSDQRAIWTSPFNLRGEDARWVAPVGAATFALFATDRHTSDELVEDGDNQTRLNVSKQISRLGAFYTTAGIAGAFYIAGVAGHDYRARETGILGAEALIDGAIVSSALKAITQRPRPPETGKKDDFFDGGVSFPSGHATSAWALATVVANEYNDRRLVQVTAYGLATAVSLSRYTGRNHFLSDVLVGSVLGYSVGRYVYHKHHIQIRDPITGEVTQQTRPSNRMPSITPMYSRAQRAYGVGLKWNW